MTSEKIQQLIQNYYEWFESRSWIITENLEDDYYFDFQYLDREKNIKRNYGSVRNFRFNE